MKYKDIKENEEVQTLISKGNENLGILGYTDHSEVHAALVAERAASILEILGYKKKQIELVKVAAYMHDIGNAINRSRHAEYGSLLANDILKETGMDRQEAPLPPSCLHVRGLLHFWIQEEDSRLRWH